MKHLAPLILLMLVAPLAAAPRPTTTRPADPLAQRAREAVKSRALAAFGGEVEQQLRAEVKKGNDLDHAEVLRLAAWREFARYFARVDTDTPGHHDTLAWLAARPDVRHALMTAVTAADAPKRVLEVLRALRADHRERVAEFSELAAAVCVVWDAPERFGGDPAAEQEVRIDPAEPSRVFGHFSHAADRLAVDPRRLPLDLLVYVVDVHLAEPEIEWATRYAARPNVAAAFFAVPFREGVAYERAAPAGPAPGPGAAAGEVAVPEMNRNSYLLPNILRRGGGVRDAAYFAAEVARANGIPAAVCVSTIDDPLAAWTGFLRPGARPTWDATSARHAQHQQWIGYAQDPQTYDWRSEAELTVLAGAVATPPRDRLASAAMVKASDLLPDADARAEMLRRAIARMPANRRAWYALADLAATEKFDDVQQKPTEELIKSHLGKRWPEFATVLRLRALKDRGTIEFDAGIARAADAVREHPELVAMVRLAQVARYRADKKNKECVELLVKLLQRQPPLAPPSVLAVMSQLDDLLHRANELPRLGEIYGAVFNAMPRPNPSYHARTTPYWRVGANYASLLEELKDPQAAAALRTKLANLVLPAPAAAP